MTDFFRFYLLVFVQLNCIHPGGKRQFAGFRDHHGGHIGIAKRSEVRGVSSFRNLGGQVVMRSAAIAWRCLLFCQSMGGQLPTRQLHPWRLLLPPSMPHACYADMSVPNCFSPALLKPLILFTAYLQEFFFWVINSTSRLFKNLYDLHTLFSL